MRKLFFFNACVGIGGISRCASSFALMCLLLSSSVFGQAAPQPAPRRPVPQRPGAAGARAPRAPGAQVPAARPLPGVAAPATPAPLTVEDDSPNSLNFQEAATDLVLMEYAQRTKRTLLVPPDLPKPAITLRTHPDVPLSDDEYLAAIEQVLNLHGIALVPVGDKFLRALPSGELRKYGAETDYAANAGGETNRYPEAGAFVSRMIELKNIDIEEAKTVIDGFTRAGAQVQTFERSNSILVTDSNDNVNRILDIIEYIDRPIVAREEPNIIQIRHAKAVDIKATLLEIIEEAQSGGRERSAPVERSAGSPGTVRRTLPAGVTLPRAVQQRAAAQPAAAEALSSLVQEAERGIIRGKVQIVADERTNLLIIITRPENMVFFNRVIDVLDIETAPDVIVEVFRLEHAEAEEVATLLNNLIGADTASTDSGPSRAAGADATDGARSQNLSEFARRRQQSAAAAAPTAETKSKVGQLDKENIKILADERTNALVIMASQADMATIRELIASVDIMLSQVIIETVMISLTFSDSVETGVDWVQRTMRSGNNYVHAASGGGGKKPVISSMNMTESVPQSGGITFYGTILDFNLDAVLFAVKSDSRARIMSSPIITTLDNKEAVVESTDRIYYSEGTTYYDNSLRTTQNIKNEDIGIKLNVTPRINKMGYVVLSVEQEIQDYDGYISDVGGEDVLLPKLTSRKMGADVAVQSGDTVVLGGLARNEQNTTATKIPLLGDLPFLGRLFSWHKRENKRTDIVVFLTPRVLNLPAEIEEETRKRKAYLDTDGVWRGDWSGSDLADPMSEQDYADMLQRARETVIPPKNEMSRDLRPLNEIYENRD